MFLKIVAPEKFSQVLDKYLGISSFFNKVVGCCGPAGTSHKEHLEEHLSVPVYDVKLNTRYLKEKNASFTFY